MKPFFARIETFWIHLAFWLSRIPLSFVLVLFAAALCFIPGAFSSISIFEKLTVYVSAKTKGISERQAEVAIISVDDELLVTWQQDLYKADQLSLLLANILHSSNSTVGLLTPNQIAVSQDALQAMADDFADDDKKIAELFKQKQTLITLLSDPRVVMGVPGNVTASDAIFDRRATTDFEAVLANTNRTLFGCFGGCEQIEFKNESDTLGLGKLDDGLTTLWFEKSNKLHPNYLAGLCLSKQMDLVGDDLVAEAISVTSSITDQYGCLSSESLPLSSFVSAYDVLDSYSARTISLNLNEALALSTFPELVLVGATSNQELNAKIANVVHGLKHNQFLVVPQWGGPAVKIIFFVIAVFLVVLMSNAKTHYLRFIVLLAILFASIAVSIGLAVVKELLVPVTLFVLFTALIYMALSLRQIVVRDRQARKSQLAWAIENSVEFLGAHDALEESVSLLEHHPNRKFALTKIADICDRLSKSPETLGQAITMLESLHPSYRNNSELVNRLMGFKSDLSRTRTLQSAESKQPSSRSSLPQKLGRYEIQRELGRGAVGVVYLGFDPAISRQVAIKTLDTTAFSPNQIEDLKERFFREAEAVGRLSHPNIVSVFDVGEESDLAFIAMDYVEGAALSHHVVPEQLLPVGDVYRIIHDVASALSYAHEQQIIHRDIKPGNIMYGASTGIVKVADFGIARLIDHSRTATGEILGSPLYMSPEQLQGSKVEATADIFSVGVTFYQLLTGHLPFDSANLAGLTYEIIHTKHKNIRAVRKDLPASAARIVNQCLQKSPKDRYQTAHELVAVLRKAIKRDFPDMAKQLGVI